MPKWNKTVNIKTFLNDPDLTSAQTGRAVLSELEKHGEFSALVGEMAQAVESMERGEPYGVAWFDDVLGRVYDVADERRIWMGV